MTSSTIINYARSLRDLMEYHHAEADAITARDILAFLAEREKSIGKSTLNTLCCALKYFYGKVLGDPDRIVDIPTPRKPKQLGELLTTSELKQLFAAARTSKRRLVLSLIYGLGLRAGEVARIRLHDFDARHRTLIIRNAKVSVRPTTSCQPQLRARALRQTKATIYAPQPHLHPSIFDRST
ncbi:tyrosine-type recombinase/integrase, partial [Neolewinella aurantiaca]